VIIRNRDNLTKTCGKLRVPPMR